MQNNYETIMIINSNLDEAATKATVEKFSNLISANGTVESTEEWGKKKLAYPIKKQSEGYRLANFRRGIQMVVQQGYFNKIFGATR